MKLIDEISFNLEWIQHDDKVIFRGIRRAVPVLVQGQSELDVGISGTL